MKRTPAARLMGAQRRAFRLLALGGVLSMGAGAASAQEQPPAKPATQGEGAELAKRVSNPISDLVSAPFQFNSEQNVGPQEDTRGERSKIRRVNPRFRSVSTPRC